MAILYLLTKGADPEPDLVRATEPARVHRSQDGGQGGFGGGEQLVAFAGPLGGQERVAARASRSPGVGMGDFGEVLLVEQGRLQRPTCCGERLDRRGPQRGQPAQVGLGLGRVVR